nr:hypothetical protein BaRGS_025179 [Batillaria attramentaria]
MPETCADVKMYDSESGVHTLKITDTSFVTAYCDHTTDGGGWTLRRCSSQIMGGIHGVLESWGKSFIMHDDGNEGDVGYYLCASHEGMKFSTVDRDNDLTTGNCAEYRGGGGWWYTRCTDVNLNGIYFPNGVATPRENGIIWKNWVGYGSSLKFAQMMFRPIAKA